MTTWILVSDASRARLFSTELRETPWTLVEEFEHPEGRMRPSEVWPSSPPGRMQQGKSVAAGRRTAMEPHTSPKDAESERFALQLAERLETAVARNEFDHLVLVAPPHLLGILQHALKKQTARRVKATINKDLVKLAEAELRARLIDEIFPPP
jgi:protein required for attachment to host cells